MHYLQQTGYMFIGRRIYRCSECGHCVCYGMYEDTNITDIEYPLILISGSHPKIPHTVLFKHTSPDEFIFEGNVQA